MYNLITICIQLYILIFSPDVDECSLSPCKESEICLNLYGSYDCLCPFNQWRVHGTCEGMVTIVLQSFLGVHYMVPSSITPTVRARKYLVCKTNYEIAAYTFANGGLTYKPGCLVDDACRKLEEIRRLRNNQGTLCQICYVGSWPCLSCMTFAQTYAYVRRN